MNRFSVVAVLVLALTAPLHALAGGGGPVDVPGKQVAPTFDGTTGNSGIMILEAGGYAFGYNMSGLTVDGSGALPVVPAGSTLSVNDALGSPDFDANGVNDIVVTAADGSQTAYLMQDAGGFVSVLSSGALPVLPAGYSLLGWPDLNGDGKSDMVMQHTGGYTVAYIMDGLTAGPATQVPGLSTAAGYSTIGFPNLDGLNGADIVLQHSGGYTVAYLMGATGTDVLSNGPVPGLAAANGYSTIGFPNLDGTAGQDIVLQHTGGYSVAYLMDGLTATGPTQVPGLANYSSSFPDLDAENGDDIVLQHTGGYSVGYLMSGTTTSSSGQVPGLAAANGYSTIGFPNLDSQNGQDIVVQHTGGYTFGYLMNGLTTASSGAVPGLPTNGTYTTVEWDNDWTVNP